jgi:mono/diheme cytochrome c family protein
MTRVRWFLVALAAAAAQPALAQDAARGQRVYETQCGGCHYERVHQRDRSRSTVKSLAELRVEVARWAAQIKQRPFTLEDLDDIAAYLNESHYRFPR